MYEEQIVSQIEDYYLADELDNHHYEQITLDTVFATAEYLEIVNGIYT